MCIVFTIPILFVAAYVVPTAIGHAQSMDRYERIQDAFYEVYNTTGNVTIPHLSELMATIAEDKDLYRKVGSVPNIFGAKAIAEKLCEDLRIENDGSQRTSDIMGLVQYIANKSM